MKIKLTNKEFVPCAPKLLSKLSSTLCHAIPKGKRRVTLTVENVCEFWLKFKGNIEVENEQGIYWYFYQGEYDKVFERCDVQVYITGKQLAVKI